MAVASSRERRSWPLLQLPKAPIFTRRHFEAEDIHDIPEPFRATVRDLTNPEHLSLHEVLPKCQEYGRDVWPDINAPLTSVAGRMSTFDQNWLGPPPKLMAQWGLRQVSPDSAECYSCSLKIRGLNNPTFCVWTRHVHFAPYCSHVQRAKRHCSLQQSGFLQSRRFSIDGAKTLM